MVYQIEPQNHPHHHPQLPCPRCGQTTIVQHGSVYTCIKCRYRRDVSQGDMPIELLSTALGIVLAFLLIILMQQSDKSPDSSLPIKHDAQPENPTRLITD